MVQFVGGLLDASDGSGGVDVLKVFSREAGAEAGQMECAGVASSLLLHASLKAFIEFSAECRQRAAARAHAGRLLSRQART